MDPPVVSIDPPVIGLEKEWHILAYTTVIIDGEKRVAQKSDFFKDMTRKKAFLEKYPGFPLHIGFHEGGHQKTMFLTNGRKAYFDTPGDQYFEDTTPEASSVRSLVIYDKFGERAVEETVAKLNEIFRDEEIFLRSFKANLDTEGNSRGTHENYWLPRQISFEDIMKKAGPHLISRIIFSGNGWLSKMPTGGKDEGKLVFTLSQRAQIIQSEINSTTTSTRPIITTKDELNGAPTSDWRRLHIILGDSLISEAALFLQIGTTYIVLKMMAAGFLDDFPLVPFAQGNLLVALHTYNQDPSLRAVHKFAKGQEYTALDLQEEYLAYAKRFYEQRAEPNAEEQKIMRRWEDAITDGKKPSPHLTLSRRVEWAAKMCLLETELERRGYGWDALGTTEIKSDRKGKKPTLFTLLKALDFGFHENSPKGFARRLIQEGSMEHMLTEKEIESVRHMPLDENRAICRARQMQECDLLASQYVLAEASTDWGLIDAKFHEGPYVRYENFDPRSREPSTILRVNKPNSP